MLFYKYSGFSVDARVCIEAQDRAGLERLRKAGNGHVCRCGKQHSEPASDKRGAKIDELTLTPLELIDRIPALVPPPCTPNPGRALRAAAPQAPGALPVGGADCPNLRGVPAAAPNVRCTAGRPCVRG